MARAIGSPGRPRARSKAYRSKTFDYALDYTRLDLRKDPSRYRVGRGEQGVLLVEPYKSEILPYWRFKDVPTARESAAAIEKLFARYKARRDFVGMDMARKFLQMGYTRARRYANHAGGRKYAADGRILPYQRHEEKARAAEVFYKAWKRVEDDAYYARRKAAHKERFG